MVIRMGLCGLESSAARPPTRPGGCVDQQQAPSNPPVPTLPPSLQPTQVAASISSGHELVITELIFGGAFTDMGTEQLLAACSCFVCQEKMPAEQKVGRMMSQIGLFGCRSL